MQDNYPMEDPVPNHQEQINRYPEDSPLSKVSYQEAGQLLKAFTDNAFYSHFVKDLQAQADAAVKEIFEGRFPIEGEQGVLLREQTIGAASAWLRFEEQVRIEQKALAELLTKE